MAARDFSQDALIDILRAWWGSEVAGVDDPFADPKPPSGTIFDVLPTIDSFDALDALLTIEKRVGFELPPRIIRWGGYDSLDDMMSDLLPKVLAMVERHRQATSKKEAA